MITSPTTTGSEPRSPSGPVDEALDRAGQALGDAAVAAVEQRLGVVVHGRTFLGFRSRGARRGATALSVAPVIAPTIRGGVRREDAVIAPDAAPRCSQRADVLHACRMIMTRPRGARSGPRRSGRRQSAAVGCVSVTMCRSSSGGRRSAAAPPTARRSARARSGVGGELGEQRRRAPPSPPRPRPRQLVAEKEVGDDVEVLAEREVLVDGGDAELRRRSGPFMVTGLPWKVMVPEVGACTPARTLTSVDFPAPLSPTRATTSPAWTSRSMSVSADTAPKFLQMPRRLRISSPAAARNEAVMPRCVSGRVTGRQPPGGSPAGRRMRGLLDAERRAPASAAGADLGGGVDPLVEDLGLDVLLCHHGRDEQLGRRIVERGLRLRRAPSRNCTATFAAAAQRFGGLGDGVVLVADDELQGGDRSPLPSPAAAG